MPTVGHSHQPLDETPQPQYIAAGASSSTSPKMTYQLPPMLLNLFAPRPPLRWVEPIDHPPEKRCTPKISGVGQYLEAMREYKDNDGYVPTDSWLQKRDRKKIEKKEKQEKLLTEGIKNCKFPRRAIYYMCLFHVFILYIYANSTVQINLARIPRSRVMPSRHSSSLVSPTAPLLTTSNASLAAMDPLSAFALLKTQPLH